MFDRKGLHRKTCLTAAIFAAVQGTSCYRWGLTIICQTPLFGYSSENKQGIASALGNLGIISQKQGDYVTAHSSLEEGLAFFGSWGANRALPRR
jgi:hypothetical protein